MLSQDQRFDQLRTILAEMTGNDAGDIHPDSSLIDDLGATEIDITRMVKRINADFEINLKVAAVLDEVETVEHLLAMIIDEADLG
jgi:acyl carrier protein